MRIVAVLDVAARDLARLPADVRRRIVTKLDQYAATGAGDVTQLKGDIAFRLRVGDCRVVFEQTATAITVLAVAHRRDVYR
ncbi:MAG: type II toxin-antitoxin system RelE/ParE family toxin [Bauldia sp.]|nr:type II toxin-antitoxin system RelE/ParE family toxin [Bauldia sp.]